MFESMRDAVGKSDADRSQPVIEVGFDEDLMEKIVEWIYTTSKRVPDVAVRNFGGGKQITSAEDLLKILDFAELCDSSVLAAEMTHLLTDPTEKDRLWEHVLVLLAAGRHRLACKVMGRLGSQGVPDRHRLLRWEKMDYEADIQVSPIVCSQVLVAEQE